jgi:predicted enzyme related to lactoylglutathione lyase
MAKVLGLGGLFFKAKDPTALLDWYRDVLGLALAEWGGVTFSPHPMVAHAGAVTVFAGFAEDTNNFEPSRKPFMVSFVVDDLDGMLANCAEHGVPVIKHYDEPYGRFAHILDPEGTKIELWQPIVPSPAL